MPSSHAVQNHKQRWIILKLINLCDEKIHQTLADIENNANWQQLAASWQGLQWLVDTTQLSTKQTKIKLLNIKPHEALTDLALSDDLTNSHLYELIYHRELDFPGGEPFGIIIADFYNEIRLLQLLAYLAQEALTILLTSTTHPDSNDHLTWSAFVCVSYPAVRINTQLFVSSSYAVAIIIALTFQQTGWFSQITDHAIKAPFIEPAHYEFIDSFTPDTKVYLSDKQTDQLATKGVIGIKSLHLSHQLAFFHAVSATQQQPLTHLLCGCRFAHYLKAILRNKTGNFTTTDQCQQLLQKWLLGYCAQSSDLSSDLAARYPLKSAHVTVKANQTNRSEFICQLSLVPHWQLNQLETKLRILIKV